MSTCILLTGLPCAGKTTIGELVKQQYPDLEFFDGDHIRLWLSRDLGFSREDRITNNRRIGYVASKIVKHGGDVLIAAIAPYQEGRDQMRKVVEGVGGRFIEVWVHATAETCRKRDVKGMWKKAERGEVEHFTGHDDPYETPVPNLTLHTENTSPKYCAEQVCDILKKVPRQLFIGRWQPLHKGHEYIIRQALKKGPVAVGVRDTEISESNPLPVCQRIEMIREAFADDDVEVFRMPDISSVNVGRNVGYDLIEYDVPPEIAAISATDIRAGLPDRD